MSKEIIKNRYVIHFEGDVDESVLVFMIRKISDNKVLPNKLKSSLKFILIELITNIISHSLSNSYGIISVEKEERGYLVTAGNYVSEQNLKRINLNIDTIKKIKDIKGHYNNQLQSVSYDKSVNLGLIEIYNRCNGKLKITTKEAGKLVFLTFKIKLDDIN